MEVERSLNSNSKHRPPRISGARNPVPNARSQTVRSENLLLGHSGAWVTVSSKYQVVIPKAVRKQLQIKPGQKVRVGRPIDGKIVIDTKSVVDRLAGSLSGVWGKQDPAEWLRADRDASD